LTQKFCASDHAVANHFSLIRSFLIDSGRSQACATRFVQNIFAQHLRCTRSIDVAKFFAPMVGKYRRTLREVKIRWCKKALFHRMIFNSRLAGDLRGIGRARSVVMTMNDVVTRAHHVSNARAIHIV